MGLEDSCKSPQILVNLQQIVSYMYDEQNFCNII